MSLLIKYFSAIRYMHTVGIVHADVKPENVYLDVNDAQELVPIVTDLGLARILNKESLHVSAFQVSEIRGGSISFAAPEVLYRFHNKVEIFDENIWKGGDVYALAITIMSLLTRYNVWE